MYYQVLTHCFVEPGNMIVLADPAHTLGELVLASQKASNSTCLHSLQDAEVHVAR